MTIGIVANDPLKKELLAQGARDDLHIEWINEPGQVTGANCYIDLLFQPTPGRIEEWRKLQPALVIVNSVITPLAKIPGNFIRVNGWPTFLKRALIESACMNGTLREKAEEAFAAFNKKAIWVPDTPGFISARVISMIINEAYFTLDEKVSSREEIDTAMKLGTNYPLGPFEWGQEIGLKNIYELLTTLAHNDPRYEPSRLLKTTTFS